MKATGNKPRFLSCLDIDIITDVLLRANYDCDYRFDFEELSQVIEHTVRKASGFYETSEGFPIMLENELRDYVMRLAFNDNERREEKRCVTSAYTILT